jgi:hypothetical protein
MSRRNQIGVLVILVAVLAVTIGVHFWPSDDSAKAAPTSTLFTPINVDNPALRMDVLQRFLSLEYKGTHRNIFIATLPPPPQPVQKAVPVYTGPPVPTGTSAAHGGREVFRLCQRFRGEPPPRVFRNLQQ